MGTSNRSNDEYNGVKDLVYREATNIKLELKDVKADVSDIKARMEELLKHKIILGKIDQASSQF